MATKPKTEQDKVATEVQEDSRRGVVGEPVTTSFDERTGAGTPPWQREDGSQDNGAADTTSETK